MKCYFSFIGRYCTLTDIYAGFALSAILGYFFPHAQIPMFIVAAIPLGLMFTALALSLYHMKSRPASRVDFNMLKPLDHVLKSGWPFAILFVAWAIVRVVLPQPNAVTRHNLYPVVALITIFMVYAPWVYYHFEVKPARA